MIQRDVEDAISEKILLGDLKENEQIVVDAEGEGILGEFTFTSRPFDFSVGNGGGIPAADSGDTEAGSPEGPSAEPVPVGADIAPEGADNAGLQGHPDDTGGTGSSAAEPLPQDNPTE